MTVSQQRMSTNLLKVMVYMPPELKESLEQLARKENRSLSNLIVTTLQKFVAESGAQYDDSAF